jgi:hypothetical protein
VAASAYAAVALTSGARGGSVGRYVSVRVHSWQAGAHSDDDKCSVKAYRGAAGSMRLA